MVINQFVKSTEIIFQMLNERKGFVSLYCIKCTKKIESLD